MNNIDKKVYAGAFLLLLNSVASVAYGAPPLNPPTVPLETGAANAVKPNIMFILDDSNSMSFEYLGDEVKLQNCKRVNGLLGLGCNQAFEPPFYAYDFNKLSYNPSVKYNPGVDANGASLGNQSITAAKKSIYTDPTQVVNLKTEFKDTYYCKVLNPTAADLANSNTCRRNGIDTPNPFNYYSQGLPNTTYPHGIDAPGTLAYYVMKPTEYCDANLVNCRSSSSAGIPAPVRWCTTIADAMSTTIPTGKFSSGVNAGRPICQKNYDGVSGYIYPRYGEFQRVNVSAAEEANYANWYTYYRSRMLVMKTAIGHAFKNIDSSKRVGFITISPGNPVAAEKFLPIQDFTPDHKAAFYAKVYSQVPTGITPLREALSRVGRYFAGKTNAINNGMINASNPDPIQYSCQQNYAILSTDGYWKGNPGMDLNGASIANVDNVDSGISARAAGVYDGGLAGSSGTLADVALYYYQNDLRPAGSTGQGGVDVSEDNVPISLYDNNHKQHMVTYAMALGMSGFVNYTKDYQKGGNADLQNIKSGAAGMCSWTSGVCNWPSPVIDELTTIDDVWHATINGRGRYYSAQTSSDIADGLQDALTSLIAQTSASAAAATSSPNITSSDNLIFYTTYRTVKWDGEIEANTIDPNTGAVSPVDLWSARALLNAKVGGIMDSRNIYYMRKKNSTTSELKDFDWGDLTAAEQAFFTNKCSVMTQCANLTAAQQALVNNGSLLVNYLRGQNGFDAATNSANPLFRTREYILGDIVDTSPVYVGVSRNSWTDAGYPAFIGKTAERTPMVYVGANDGQIHAFNARTGNELWAVIPNQMLNKLHKLADSGYGYNHQFYVDGPLVVSDAKDGSNWKSILVSGMGPGGTGYIALDVTDPDSPQPLWEFCKDATACAITDSDLGYTYGNPIITKRAFDSKWVVYVSAGYDNPSGKGLVYELDAFTGTILRKLYTGTGTAASPAGLSKINTYHVNFSQDNTAKYIYAGDMDGNIWKWDLTTAGASTTATKMGSTKNAAGVVQPITSKIELGTMQGNPLLMVGTGRFLTVPDYYTSDIQSFYTIRDNNTDFGNLRFNPAMVKQTMVNSGITTSLTANSVNWSSNIGWFFDLTAQSGERVNVDPILALGVVNIVGNVPMTNACTSGGNAWIYQVDFNTGGAVRGNNNIFGKKFTGGFVVGQVVARLTGSGNLKNFITDASGSVTPVAIPTPFEATAGKKAAWREIYKGNQ